MATFNGTSLDDTIGGSNDDDIINGFAGEDNLNGASGNDTIDGGEGNDVLDGGSGDDSILGDAGNDVIQGEGGADILDGGAGDDNITGGKDNDTVVISKISDFTAADTMDGGEGDDTLVANLLTLDDLTQGTASAKIGGVASGAAGVVNGFEFVQVSNANDFILNLDSGLDQDFAFDVTLKSNSGVGTAVDDDLEGATYADLTTNIVTADTITFDKSKGVVVDGTTYGHEDTFTTADGGTVTVTWDTDVWNFKYVAAVQSTVTILETTDDPVENQVLSAQATEATTGQVIDVKVTLQDEVGTTVDLKTREVTADTRVEGSTIADTITDGAGNDTIIGEGGIDVISIESDGDNRVWAGAGDDDGDNIDIIAGADGDNIVAGGAGNDDIDIAGDGANQAWGGAADDDIDVAGDGNNIIGGGAGDDELTVAGDGANQVWGGADDDDTNEGLHIDDTAGGDNIVGGGAGADKITIDGDGNNTIYGGTDEVTDTILINATASGNNTIFGGGTAGSNDIDVEGTGANVVYNGGGNDNVELAATATGDNVLYGGGGNDTFVFNNSAVGTIIFEAGNGNDSITNFNGTGGGGDFDQNQLVDLSALGFADADDVIANMTDTGGTTTLFVTAGQNITFTGVSLAEFQAADSADWLIL